MITTVVSAMCGFLLMIAVPVFRIETPDIVLQRMKGT